MVREVRTERKNGRGAYRAHGFRRFGAPTASPPILASSRSSYILGPMDELEELRRLVGHAADTWTSAQLEQLRLDMDAVAELLLDLYRVHRQSRGAETCRLPDFDVQPPER